MSKRVTDKVTWVGKIDWELKKFHGDELSTMEGSSYNSYLIRDKKTVLMDTVWGPYDTEFVNRLKEEIDLKEIDYIVMNHNESDHSGTLPALMREIPDTPIYCTKKGESILRGLYHQDWNYVNVKTGDELEIGDSKLVFVEASMLHWPDTMMTYMTGDNILFSNDVFGQHYASEMLYDDMDDISKLLHEAEKYYTNIITPFSTFVTKKLAEVQGMNLYAKWANNYQEDQITLIYDTMWQSTRKMAEAIAEGIHQASPNTTIKILNAVKNDKNDILVEVFKSKAIIVGSPTINNGFSYAIAGILEMIKGLKFKNKKAASFGSYGWSGEAAKLIREFLEESKFAIVNDGIRVNWAPDQETIEQLREYGRKFVEEIAE